MQQDLVFPEAVDLAPPVQKPALKAPWHLFLIGATAVLWNALGVFDFLATLTRFPPYIDNLPEGAVIPGPAIVTEMDSTTLIESGCVATVDAVGNILINPA